MVFYDNAIQKARHDAIKNQMVASCFTAWQMGAGGEKYKSFESYLKVYGLNEKKEKMTPEDLKEIANKNIANAEKIKRIHQDWLKNGNRSI